MLLCLLDGFGQLFIRHGYRVSDQTSEHLLQIRWVQASDSTFLTPGAPIPVSSPVLWYPAGFQQSPPLFSPSECNRSSPRTGVCEPCSLDLATLLVHLWVSGCPSPGLHLAYLPCFPLRADLGVGAVVVVMEVWRNEKYPKQRNSLKI